MILVFGSINLDTIYRLPALPRPGQTVLGTGSTEPGGKGANQAAAAARDGGTVAMAGAVGRDTNAVAAVHLLRAAGVDLSRLVETDLPTGTAAVCVDPAGENQIAVAAGANTLARAVQVSDIDLGPHVTVLLQREIDVVESAALVQRARVRGARVILNLAPAGPFDPTALAALDWLVVNEAEAAWLGGNLNCAADAQTLHSALGTGVVRTLGADGVEWAARDLHGTEPAHPVVAVDTTAAGDCFTGVFAAGLDRGLDPANAISRANRAAALCCTRPGSQRSLPTAEQIGR